MERLLKAAVVAALLTSPALVWAQPARAPANFTEFVFLVVDLVSRAIPLVIGLAFAVFLWGAALFILKAGDEKKRAEGKKLIFWGLIALFVMFSVWGIVYILTLTFEFSAFGVPQLPTGGSTPPPPTISPPALPPALWDQPITDPTYQPPSDSPILSPTSPYEWGTFNPSIQPPSYQNPSGDWLNSNFGQ